LRKAGTVMLTQTVPLEITPKGVRVISKGEEKFVAADSVISALGMKANQDMQGGLSAGAIPVFVIGDCSDPKKIAEANKAGYRAALKV
jgi:2,4-dienoyl-CoA reductase (NADPH2)